MFIIVRMKNKQTGAEDRMNQNEKKEMKIRIAKEEDAEAMLAIYAPYIEHTVITYEYDVPTVEEFRGRIRHVLERYPYLVAELNGEICGYAYASAFHDRPAGGWNVETSIYVDQNKKGIGIGTALYDKLEKILKRQNILNMNACIACTEIEDEYLTNASIRYHEHLGYRMVGWFTNCGYKFHRWYNLAWMEKEIGEHVADQPPVIAFPNLPKEYK